MNIKKFVVKKKRFRVLVLDGGGSKGLYTLGVLEELERKIGNLSQYFDLIYGTSTGSIIASLIALGYPVPEIKILYLKLIPQILTGSPKKKSFNLKTEGDKMFGEKKFDSFKTNIGIVAMNYETQTPLIFKSNIEQSYGMRSSFIPGFGCTISDAVQASCSAFPLFDIKTIQTTNKGCIQVVDGGFVANNATLFAIIDSNKAFGFDETQIDLLSVGVGEYQDKPISLKDKLYTVFKAVQLIFWSFTTSTNTNEVMTKLLYPNLNMERINDSFTDYKYRTNMLEKNPKVLKKMIQLGQRSYSKYESKIHDLFKL